MTIENSDISSPYNTGPNRKQVAIKDIYGDATGTTITGNNIWNTSTAVQIGEGTVANNYIHDLGYLHRRPHHGITSEGGERPRTITQTTPSSTSLNTRPTPSGCFENFWPQ